MVTDADVDWLDCEGHLETVFERKYVFLKKIIRKFF